MIHYILLPIPFLFHLYADWWLIHKGKKDVHILVICLMVIAVSIQEISMEHVKLNLGWMALASSPFPFFDIALNRLRKLRWDYLSTTNKKRWDSTLVKINPVALLVGRIILAAGLVVYWYNVTFGR